MHSFGAIGLLGDPNTVRLPLELQNGIFSILEDVHPEAERLGLEASIRTLHRLVGLTHSAVQGHEPPTAAAVQRRLAELRENIEIELLSRRFLFVPSPKAALFDQEELFGPAVAQNFRMASFHIREAGACLALGRPTAAVYHLMCVLEMGLDSLADSVGMPCSERNWGAILADISTRIQSISLGKSATPANWDKTWYNEVAVELFHFKEAWRNHTSHGRSRFTETEAENIFNHVKAFMGKLATRLRERGT
jgi:hypothetical protein